MAGLDPAIHLRAHAMSRAFVKESSESARPPEKMVEDGPNPVTPEGMAQIEAHITHIEAALKTERNVLLRETLERDLRYWSQRKLTAEIMQPENSLKVAFGSKVVIERGGRQQTFHIVGVDEANPAKGLISFRSPLAHAIIGSQVNDVIEPNEPLGKIVILSIEQ